MWAAMGAAYFAFALLVPVLAAFQAESRLPICCRRGGAHHCQMADMGVLNIGNAVGVRADGHCPLWPHAAAVTLQQDFVMPAQQRLATAMLPAATLRLRNAELCRIARERQLQLRGPPALIFA